MARDNPDQCCPIDDPGQHVCLEEGAAGGESRLQIETEWFVFSREEDGMRDEAHL